MNKTRISPLLILLLLWILFGVLIAATYQQWPESVATHFDLSGNPNGWMDRIPNIVAYVALGFALPLMIYGLFCLASVFPTHLVNIPHRAYWLAPERRDSTMRELRRQSLWFGCLILLYNAGLYLVTLEANQHDPPRITSNYIVLLFCGFLLSVAIWVVFLIRRFRKAE
jgi:uncharacterized membrane protein